MTIQAGEAVVLPFPEQQDAGRVPAPAESRESRLDASAWDLGPAFAARIEGGACHGAMRHVGDRPSVTPQMLAGMKAYGLRLRGLADLFRQGEPPFRYVTLVAEGGGPFNLGGDLALFHECLTTGDRARLAAYGRACVDTVYWNHRRYGLPVITVALVQGDALGGGFETALSHDLVVAEEGAKLGLPEIGFNLFPGMGAYSFIARRIGPARARDLILGGELHSARDMHALGLVHHVVPDGTGREFLRKLMRDLDRRYAAHRAVLDLDRRVNPVTRDELRDVVGLWVDTAFSIRPSDLRMMQKLIARQQALAG